MRISTTLFLLKRREKKGFMFQVYNALQRNFRAVPQEPIIVAQNNSVQVLPDNTKNMSIGQVLKINLFNGGANPCYYNYNNQCDNVTNWVAILQSMQMLTVEVLSPVSVYCTGAGGTVIGITFLTEIKS